MIVYDKEQKEIVIPNGIGNINLFNNGVEAGYNQGYEQGQADMAAKARVLDVTKNGTYMSKYSDPIISANVTGRYADGTDFYNYAELNGKIFNTKIAGSENSRLEFWYKGDGTVSGDGNNVIIGSGDTDKNNSFQARYYNDNNNIVRVQVGVSIGDIHNWDDNVWHHLIISKTEGIWLDGNNQYGPLYGGTIDGEFFINGIGYDVSGDGGNIRTANGCFGMIKIDDTIIIPTADGFLNTNTGELLEVVQDGSYVFTENPPIYGEGELYKTINVNVPDLNGSYDEGYAQGKIDGINEQKGKLESINITENGTYRKEDGYNEVVVNVPDLNGDYNEGYEQGQTDAAAKARVLNVTENGNYLSKFSDPILPTVTGVYADGTKFYNYAELNGKVFNTKIAATKDSRIELWWKNDGSYVELGAIIGAQNDNIFKFVEFSANEYRIEYGYPYGGSFFEHNFTYDMSSRWNHIIFSKQDGLNVNGELICEIQGEGWRENAAISNFWINASYIGEVGINANGTFGMIKIDDVIIIPTANGFQNVNTGELLEVVQDGGYKFIENLPTYGEGELYKTINVNVLPKVNVKEAGLKFGYSKFTEVPEWADFEGITDMTDMFTWCENLQTIPLIDTSNVIYMSYMFYKCTNLQTIPLIDTSNVTSMNNMFYKCPNLQTIPLLDTSNVTGMSFMFDNCNSLQTIPQLDTSNVIDMSYMFCYCENLQTIPLIDTSNVTNMDNMFRDCPNLQTIPSLDTSKVFTMESIFGECRSLTSLPALNAQSLNMPSYVGIFGYSELPNLTDLGGFLNLKCSLTNDNNLQRLPNLTKESCLNILNGLYDFTGNGETPNSEQGQLKVHPNFLATVGDKISIGVAKGWSISA